MEQKASPENQKLNMEADELYGYGFYISALSSENDSDTG